MIGAVSRGPSRRVRRLFEAGQLSNELLAKADREADLLEHPYLGVEHVELARLQLAGKVTERQALLSQLTTGVRRRWWRPRGPHSAFRRSGLKQTRAARRAAEEDEHQLD
jgi:hypothetical protein